MPHGHTLPRSGRRDSNPRPSPWQGDALPTEPRPRAPGVRSRTVADPAAGANSEPRFAWIHHASIRVETRLSYGRNMTVPAHGSVPYDTDIAQAAALMADPTRAAMLRALMSDRPLAAGELARLAG